MNLGYFWHAWSKWGGSTSAVTHAEVLPEVSFVPALFCVPIETLVDTSCIAEIPLQPKSVHSVGNLS